MAKDYYAALGLDRDATEAEIKSVYRDAVKSCHPDVAGDDPAMAARFQELTEAYKVLSDAFRRRQHDQELPLKSYPLRRPTAERVWKEATEVILLRSDRVGPFQRSMQAGKPLALEAEEIVVGYGSEDYKDSAHLEVPANRHALLEALELVAGRQVGFRRLQGETLADWERIKAGEAKAASRHRPATATKTQNLWEELLTRLNRGYNELSPRKFPQERAAFLAEALGWIAETAQRARAAGAAEETLTREVAKALDRVASLVEIPPALAALELSRRAR